MKTNTKPPAKTPAKAPIKPSVKAPVKAPAKASGKAQADVPEKAQKKGGKVFLLTFLIVLAVLGAVWAGLFFWKQMPEEQAPTLEIDETNPNVLGQIPPAGNEADIQNSLDYAIGQTPDAVGWIQIPDTDINGLIMQADDNRYYERRNEDGNYDVYGCYFADYECALGAREDFSQNTIVYGHGNSTDDPNGKRFSQLFRFLDQDFAQKHPYVTITTQEGSYIFQIFSIFYTSTDFNYIEVNMNDRKKLSIANKALELSIYDYGVTVSEEDRLLTLSTCALAEGKENERFVVMGKLCPENFSKKESILLTKREP